MHPDLKSKTTGKVPDVGDRVIAIARGDGVDPFSIKSTSDNPFLQRPSKKPELSTALIKGGALVTKETAIKVVGKRIVKVTAERYDAILHFNDGSSLRLAEGGEGMEWIFNEAPVTTNKKKKP